MATIDLLNTEFANLFRRPQTQADAAYLTQLAQTPVSQFGNVANETVSLVRTAVSTTEVAVLSYGFFTGVTLRASGLDYLLSTTGPNPNNLNSAYYAGFSTENRYINFAVNLGKAGEGAAAFQAGYGALTLQGAADKAYAAIFGSAANEPSDLLTAVVPNGLGGTYTRADYFASYGGDGLNGIGTKAAMVGWLLSVAAANTLGPYAQAALAYMQDLAPDAQAQFAAPFLGTYGPGGDYAPGGRLDPGLPGDTFTITHDQAVLLNVYVGPGPYYAAPPVYATPGNDVVTSTTGIDATNPNPSVNTFGVLLGAGNDTLTVTGGFASGRIDAGPGDDVITLSAFNGLIYTGPGYDTVAIGSFTSATVPGAFQEGPTPAIADFTRGQDHLIFSDAVGPGRVSPVDVRGAATLAVALTAIAGVTAAGANTVFEWGGDTYVFHQNTDPAVNLGAAAGSDGLIQLVGVTGAVLDARDGRAYDIHFGS